MGRGSESRPDLLFDGGNAPGDGRWTAVRYDTTRPPPSLSCPVGERHAGTFDKIWRPGDCFRPAISIMLTAAFHGSFPIGESSMRDETCLRRQWALLRALASRHLGLTIRQMADDLGVTGPHDPPRPRRLPRVGFPLEEAVGEFGRKTWTDQGGPRPAPARLHLRRGRSPCTSAGGCSNRSRARRSARPPGTPSGRSGPRSGRGPWTTSNASRRLSTRPASARRDYAPKSELIDGLRVAVEDGKEARMLYRSEARRRGDRPRRPPLRRGLPPRGALPGRARPAQEARSSTTRSTGSRRSRSLGAAPRRPEGFDLAAHMASAFGVYRATASRPRSRSGSAPRRPDTSRSRGGTRASG